MKYLDIKGCNIIDKNGALIGVVKDCLVDFKNMKISSIICVHKQFMTKYCILSLKSIECCENNIITREDAEKVSRGMLKKFKHEMLEDLLNKEIMDVNRKNIGNVSDIVFDEISGDIKAFICSRGFFDDIFEGRKVIFVDKQTSLNRGKIVINNNSIDMVNDIFFRKFIQ
jgi:uncharacterized protein YrrD